MDYYTYNESAKNYVQQSEFIKTNLVHNGPQTSTYRHSNANSKKLGDLEIFSYHYTYVSLINNV